VRGTTGDTAASAEISRILSDKLGEAEDFRVNVRYEEKLDPVAGLPSPEECAAGINAALAESKITFAPGSAEIEASSARTVDRIAEILKTCPDVAMEIGGYTDSQGREEMNQVLSQRRADAVLSALLARRVLTSNLTAFGYGEDNPIADNATEEGREANRRIEFRLIGAGDPEERPEPVTEEEPGAGDDVTEAADADPAAMRPAARPAELVEDAAASDAADDDGANEPAAGAEDGETAPEPQGGSEPEDAPEATTTPDDDTAAESEAAGEDDAEPAAAAGEVEAADPGEASEAVTDAPVVVHPELEGIRPQPRPDRDDG
jgi:OOP family OmpA-OmpF porin